MDPIIVIVGALLALAPALDVFRELFQPRGRGLISGAVARVWWRVLRRPARRSSIIASFAGPIIMLTIILTWLACSSLGWALLYMPSMDGTESFIGHASDSRFVNSMYLSLVTISTLGYGDVVPSADWALLLVPLEALFGLGVAAGTIGWLMNLQPVLSHRSALAGKVGLIEYAERAIETPIEQMPGIYGTIGDLTTHLASVHSDLMHFPISYYFFAGERLRSLPDQVAVLRDIAERCSTSEDVHLRLQAAMLDKQIDVTVRAVARQFLHAHDGGAVQQFIDAWRVDHEHARRQSA